MNGSPGQEFGFRVRGEAPADSEVERRGLAMGVRRIDVEISATPDGALRLRERAHELDLQVVALHLLGRRGHDAGAHQLVGAKRPLPGCAPYVDAMRILHQDIAVHPSQRICG